MTRLLALAAVLVLVLAACGNTATTSTSAGGSMTSTSNQSTTTQTTGSTTSATAATTTAAVDLPRIKVEDGVKTEGLDTISVRIGETVRFEVEADIADEVHVHGYDLAFETVPNQEVLVEFVADATGIFEVEIEGLGLHIVDIEVTP